MTRTHLNSLDVATLETGEFAVTWSYSGGNSWGTSFGYVYLQVFDKYGNPSGPAEKIYDNKAEWRAFDASFEGTTAENVSVRIDTRNIYGHSSSNNIDVTGYLTDFYDVSDVSDADSSDNWVSESAAHGASVGVTVSAVDADTTDGVTYTLIDNADGRFAIDPDTGEVFVRDPSLLDFETGDSHVIQISAESSDGSVAPAETFTISIGDVDEVTFESGDQWLLGDILGDVVAALALTRLSVINPWQR